MTFQYYADKCAHINAVENMRISGASIILIRRSVVLIYSPFVVLVLSFIFECVRENMLVCDSSEKFVDLSELQCVSWKFIPLFQIELSKLLE